MDGPYLTRRRRKLTTPTEKLRRRSLISAHLGLIYIWKSRRKTLKTRRGCGSTQLTMRSSAYRCWRCLAATYSTSMSISISTPMALASTIGKSMISSSIQSLNTSGNKCRNISVSPNLQDPKLEKNDIYVLKYANPAESISQIWACIFRKEDER
jgi:hypothetical protein